MITACCCYTVDEGYLFATLVSAIQARAAVSATIADIKIFCIGEGSETVALYWEICEAHGIDLVGVPSKAIDDMPIMFARFYLSRLLDDQYANVVYLDRIPRSQVRWSLYWPFHWSRRFLAAHDPMSIMIEEPRREWRRRRAYVQSIGLQRPVLPRYFNSGVLRFNLRDWAAISCAALAVYANHDHSLIFPDQDALKPVFGGDYLPMSYRWEFPIFFLGCGLQTLITPTVYHFMSNPRPWNGALKPSGKAWHAPYRRVAEVHPKLRRFNRSFNLLRATRYLAPQRIRALLEGPAWSSRDVREKVAFQEAEAYVRTTTLSVGPAVRPQRATQAHDTSRRRCRQTGRHSASGRPRPAVRATSPMYPRWLRRGQ